MIGPLGGEWVSAWRWPSPGAFAGTAPAFESGLAEPIVKRRSGFFPEFVQGVWSIYSCRAGQRIFLFH